ncbi:hypothetical protein [Synechocystis sp. PCC 7509]|uniref:hypothetical protein n=1 Tax=Synechocystis sp. PCC 7509 TaxID=927677 RepID=UPI0002ACEBDD|nr:hypothetical protein [Synechocystis sp. PCC 7509]
MNNYQRQAVLIPRNLSILEPWGFCLTRTEGWTGKAPVSLRTLATNRASLNALPDWILQINRWGIVNSLVAKGDRLTANDFAGKPP